MTREEFSKVAVGDLVAFYEDDEIWQVTRLDEIHATIRRDTWGPGQGVEVYAHYSMIDQPKERAMEIRKRDVILFFFMLPLYPLGKAIQWVQAQRRKHKAKSDDLSDDL